MKTIKWLFLSAAVVMVLAIQPTRVDAYDQDGHEYIVREAIKLFSFTEAVAYLENIVAGARDEDITDHLGDDEEVTGNHFWDADTDNTTRCYLTDFGIDYMNAQMRSQRFLSQSLIEYMNGNKSQAYEYFGHVVHLMADMTVPAHAHVDSHILDEPYEDWLSSGIYSDKWNVDSAINAGGLIIKPEGVYDTISALPNDEKPLIRIAIGYDLYYLMYTANQYGDYFASEEDDGDTYDRFSWVDYSQFVGPTDWEEIIDNSSYWICPTGIGCPIPTPYVLVDNDNDDDQQLTQVGDKCFVYAIRATATMFKSLANDIDTLPPNTEYFLVGTEGSNGWYTGDVEVTLGARDRRNDNSWGHVEKTEWRYLGDGEWIFYNMPFTINKEGENKIEYRSTDDFGNVEEPKLFTVNIDKSAPVINVTSPIDIDFYLTSGSLTIDYEVLDAISGMGLYFSKLDEKVVSDGDVIDLDAIGGRHIFKIKAFDNAGNSSETVVEFSIKISSTVDFKPDVFNVKSGSDSVKVYVEFPSGYDVSKINVSSVRLIPKLGWFLPAKASPTAGNDYDRDGVPDMMVTFSRKALVNSLGAANGVTSIIVAGQLSDTTEFYGTEPVLVTNPPK